MKYSERVYLRLTSGQLKKLLDDSKLHYPTVGLALGHTSNYMWALISRYKNSDDWISMTRENTRILADMLDEPSAVKLMNSISLTPRGAGVATGVSGEDALREYVAKPKVTAAPARKATNKTTRKYKLKLPQHLSAPPVGTATYRRELALSRAVIVLNNYKDQLINTNKLRVALGVRHDVMVDAIKSGILDGEFVRATGRGKGAFALLVNGKLLRFVESYWFQSSNGYHDLGAYKNIPSMKATKLRVLRMPHVRRTTTKPVETVTKEPPSKKTAPIPDHRTQQNAEPSTKPLIQRTNNVARIKLTGWQRLCLWFAGIEIE